MIHSIEALKEDLWERWRKHFHHTVLEEETASVRRLVYSRTRLFDLKEWTPKKFAAGGRFSPRPIAGSDNWVYQLDEKGEPHSVSGRHSVNRIEWRGAYRYGPDEVEYIEICFPTRVPSRYDRVTVREQQLATFQRLSLNSGGHFPIWSSMDRNDLLEKISADSHNFQIWIEEYEAKDGLIRTGEAYTEGLGVPPRYSSLFYFYSDMGKLQRIVQRWKGGQEQTVFAARTGVSLKELTANLSQRLANRIIDVLRRTSFDSPLVAVELSFRSGDRYVPLVIPFTEADCIISFPVLTYDSQRVIDLPEKDFQPEMKEFEERMRTSGRYEAGTKMLRAAAQLVTTKQHSGTLPTAEGFVTYAVDGELEVNGFSKILKDCGADSSSLRIWKKRGWLG